MTRWSLVGLVALATLLWPPLVRCEEGGATNLSAGTPAAISTPVQIRAPLSVAPGDPVVVTILGSGGVGRAVIRGADGNAIAESPAFVVALTSQVKVGYAILGLDTTVPAGSYLIELLSGNGDPVATRLLVVDPRDFRREDIPLPTNLTELREREDPQKIVEALRLQEIVGEFDAAAVYHLGPFSWPIPLTRRTSLFGDRRTYLYADGGRAFVIHSGLDLASPTGTPVGSSGAGRVRLAAYRIVTGNSVVIEHLPGVFSLYYHLDSLSVAAGDMVQTGDLIGTVGATGLATGPHLHWEFRIGGVSVDPERVLAGLLVDFDR